MNNWKLRAEYQGDNDSDYIEVNGYLAAPYSSEPMMRVVPFGNVFAAPLRTAESETFGPVSNQVPGICNGVHTHTGAAAGTGRTSTTITGNGTGATFKYGFLADGTLSYIEADGQGSGYLVGDKISITTHQGHVIEFRLVDGSNATTAAFRLIHDRQNPTPFPVHRAKCVETSGQFYFHVYDYEHIQLAQPQNKLLDKYPDAAAAYGLRKLRSAYLGPAIRVRRESTGWPEIDIHFDSQGNLDTKALLDFAGTNSVRVKTWYDQSGGGNDATQSTNASQPTIVNGGVLSTVNGKPALEFDGTDDKFDIDSSDLYGQTRLDAYLHYQTSDDGYLILCDKDSDGRFSFVPQDGSSATSLTGNYNNGANAPTLYVNGVKIPAVPTTNTRDELHTAMVTNGAEHSNGAVVVHQGAGTAAWTDFGISTYPTQGFYNFDGKMTEMVLYNTDQSANREDIEKDMALHSGAFQVEDAPLLDAYGGAHAAYSLRKLNSDYTGSAIRIRKGGTADEKDVGFDANGNIDEATILGFGTADVYVTKWYDQSGNGNDLVQSATTKQPHLRNYLGQEQRVDGRLAMKFDGSTDGFPFDNTGLDIGNLSSFAVMKYSTTDNSQMGLGLSGSTGGKRWYAPYLNGGNFNFGYATSSTAITTSANTLNNLHTMIAGATQGDVEAFVNGTSAGTASLDTGISSAAGIGNLGGSFIMNGFIQEVVVYSSDQSERREGIERNISNHYDL